jgi:hypothetical protein
VGDVSVVWRLFGRQGRTRMVKRIAVFLLAVIAVAVMPLGMVRRVR